ncbi:uncharacterized protein LOC116918934, partial [Daphnia magna]|uniref:uncharacterized protein LOC116918934 n=1 Tax=Daphnia magna TaxID=35525 RepID=UPI001E1BC2A4
LCFITLGDRNFFLTSAVCLFLREAHTNCLISYFLRTILYTQSEGSLTVLPNEGADKVTANKESAENIKENDMVKLEVKFGLVNAQGLFCKRFELKEKIEKSNFDFVTVTETWKMSNSELKEACPEGFKFKYKPRKDERQGGGIALFFQDSIISTPRSRKDYETFECLDTSLYVLGAGTDIRLINIYRPPDSNKIKFLEEFESLLAASNRSEENLFITGDFNLHVENPKSREKEFLELIKSHGFKQHVKKPTQENGGILDLIMTDPDDLFVKNVRVSEFFSDHKFVQCMLQI